jgi:toxin ParE1/3/4
MSFRLRPAAEADIEAITLYIAERNPTAARRWYDDVLRHCRQLGEMPGMGIARPEVRPKLRTFPVGNYLILYQQLDQGAEIIRVIHGARQWQELI